MVFRVSLRGLEQPAGSLEQYYGEQLRGLLRVDRDDPDPGAPHPDQAATFCDLPHSPAGPGAHRLDSGFHST